MRVTIRLATAEDATVIHQMLLESAASMGKADQVHSTPESIALHGFGADPAFEVLIAEVGGVPAGMSLFFTSFSTWRGTIGGYIQDIFVLPEVRRTGLATRLLAATAAHVRASGGTYVRLSVASDNLGAQRFYARTRMVWSTEERIYVLDGAQFEALSDVEGYEPWRG